MIGNFLKQMRSSGYSGKPEKPDGEDKKEEKFSDDKPNETPRIISLLDDEMKSFEGASPGEDVACEVHGSLEQDGHFHVLSVQPLNKEKGYGSEEEMAGQIAERVQPGAAHA